MQKEMYQCSAKHNSAVADNTQCCDNKVLGMHVKRCRTRRKVRVWSVVGLGQQKLSRCMATKSQKERAKLGLHLTSFKLASPRGDLSHLCQRCHYFTHWSAISPASDPVADQPVICPSPAATPAPPMFQHVSTVRSKARREVHRSSHKNQLSFNNCPVISN